MSDEELDAEIEAGITSNTEELAPPVEEPEQTEEEPEQIETEGDEPSGPAKDEFTEKVRKRINKRTADYYREKNRADELERKIADLEASKPVSAENEPKEEDFDYDPAQYQKALVKYYAKQEVAKSMQGNQAQKAKARSEEILQKYNAKVEKSGLEDFDEVVTGLFQNKILGQTAYEALLEQDNGPQIEYYLGKNLELAAKIGSKTPAQQAAEIGKLSVKLAAPKGKKVTKAPDPVTPAKSGGGSGSTKDVANMSMDELMEDERF
jgi:hypothetical protein